MYGRYVPDLFCQLYMIHSTHNNRVYADLYCLLPDKKTETYTRMFTLTMQRALSYGYYFYPGTCMIDFELAVHNVIRTIFPDCIIKGCLFHFSQALWRKLQEVELSKSHRNNGEIKERFRLFWGLPFVPVPHIFKAFQLIVCNYQSTRSSL